MEKALLPEEIQQSMACVRAADNAEPSQFQPEINQNSALYCEMSELEDSDDLREWPMIAVEGNPTNLRAARQSPAWPSSTAMKRPPEV